MAAMSARFRLNIVLAAEEGAGLRILKALDQSGHRIALVLTSPPGTHGSALWSYAEARGHPLLPASTVKDAALADIFRKEDVDLFLNVHSLHIVNGAILESPRIGAFNL